MTKLLTFLFALLTPARASRLGFRPGLHYVDPFPAAAAPKPSLDKFVERLFDGLARAVATAGRLAPPSAASFASTGRRVLDELEPRFSQRWPRPGHARLAAGLLVSALCLSCAGVVGAVAMAAPSPGIHLQRLAGPRTIAAVPAAELVKDEEPSPPPAAAPVPVEAPLAPEPVEEPPAPPATGGTLPVGKGMWIWLHEQADGGDPDVIVRRALDAGLTHIYVRTGTLKGGFIGGPFLDRLLPVAHANGIRVYGWDFPYLKNPGDEVNRALAAIRHTTPDGHRIDGFSADIESPAEGTNNNIEFVSAYVNWLRDNVGPNYPLIATIPNPTPTKVASGFPYAQVIAPFSAVAPMVYWMNRDPGTDVANAIAYLSQFGKPVFPVGQAYDGAPEGGPAGVPGRDQITRFMQAADQHGAGGVSFWSWQHATQEVWEAVRDSPEFRLDVGGPNGEGLSAGMVRAYQTNLTSLGFPVPADGVWGPATVEAVLNYQRAARLPATGYIDDPTRRFLLTPVAAPIHLP